MTMTSFFLIATFCASISSQGVQATDKRFFTFNQEWSKLPDRLVLALLPMSDMLENTGFRKNTEYFRHHNQWSDNVKPSISVIWDYLTRSMLLGIMK